MALGYIPAPGGGAVHDHDADYADVAHDHDAAYAGIAHVSDTANPHGVSKAQVGLSNVTNDAQLKIASNLSDVANAGAARTNLGLGNAATRNVGATAADVAQGDHDHDGRYYTESEVDALIAGVGGGGGASVVWASADTATTTVANTTALTTIATFAAIPGGTLAVGDFIEIVVVGSSAVTSTPTLAGALRVNGGTVIDIAAGQVSSFGWGGMAYGLVRAIGASGSVEWFTDINMRGPNRGGLFSNVTGNLVANAVATDTTAAITLTFAVQWSAASASNVTTLRTGFAKIVRQS